MVPVYPHKLGYICQIFIFERGATRTKLYPLTGKKSELNLCHKLTLIKFINLYPNLGMEAHSELDKMNSTTQGQENISIRQPWQPSDQTSLRDPGLESPVCKQVQKAEELDT